MVPGSPWLKPSTHSHRQSRVDSHHVTKIMLPVSSDSAARFCGHLAPTGFPNIADASIYLIVKIRHHEMTLMATELEGEGVGAGPRRSQVIFLRRPAFYRQKARIVDISVLAKTSEGKYPPWHTTPIRQHLVVVFCLALEFAFTRLLYARSDGSNVWPAFRSGDRVAYARWYYFSRAITLTQLILRDRKRRRCVSGTNWH